MKGSGMEGRGIGMGAKKVEKARLWGLWSGWPE